MDPSAPGYYEGASIDNGNCFYEADVHFWIQQNTWSAYSSAGVNSLELFVDGNSIGTLPPNAAYLAEPLCSNTIVLKYKHPFLSSAQSKSGTFSYLVKDQNGTTLTNGTAAVNTDGCNIEEIL